NEGSNRKPSPFNAGEHNGTGSYNDYYDYYTGYIHSIYIFSIFTIFISILGILGNGMVIWLLIFCVKRNHFTTYVLNLAIADFGFLITLTILIFFWLQIYLQISFTLFSLFNFICSFMFCTSQYLLTVISVDRYVSVFFPLWHHCRQPTHLSATVCALIWILSFLPPGISFILRVTDLWILDHVLLYQFILNGFLCLPLMTISSLTLFIKFWCKSKQQRRKKLLTIILVNVFFFIFFSFPINAYSLFYIGITYLPFTIMCACLNSSVNPLIYYLVGRPKKGRSKKSMKAALQNLFKEGENPAGTVHSQITMEEKLLI
uniref:G-protein coupled receptors family 1 profile domain-containing protein n=1 Tax=Salvator merianae TaxID=96440 RepID=A0A8D0DMF7_SALMN